MDATRQRPRFAPQGWVGLFLLAVCWPLNWLLPGLRKPACSSRYGWVISSSWTRWSGRRAGVVAVDTCSRGRIRPALHPNPLSPLLGGRLKPSMTGRALGTSAPPIYSGETPRFPHSVASHPRHARRDRNPRQLARSSGWVDIRRDRGARGSGYARVRGESGIAACRTRPCWLRCCSGRNFLPIGVLHFTGRSNFETFAMPAGLGGGHFLETAREHGDSPPVIFVLSARRADLLVLFARSLLFTGSVAEFRFYDTAWARIPGDSSSFETPPPAVTAVAFPSRWSWSRRLKNFLWSCAGPRAAASNRCSSNSNVAHSARARDSLSLKYSVVLTGRDRNACVIGRVALESVGGRAHQSELSVRRRDPFAWSEEVLVRRPIAAVQLAKASEDLHGRRQRHRPHAPLFSPRMSASATPRLKC